MEVLNSIFQFWLLILETVVNDAVFVAMFWFFFLTITVLLTIKLIRECFAWKM